MNTLDKRLTIVLKYYILKNGGDIDFKKLQNLCYYTQAWSLAINNKRFIEYDFEAWMHGPVIPELWEICKDMAYDKITESSLNIQSIDLVLSNKDLNLLNDVWEAYGKFSGSQLELLVQSESPWLNQRIGLGVSDPCKNKILDTDMKNYYSSL